MNNGSCRADISLFESISNSSGGVYVVNGWKGYATTAAISALAALAGQNLHPIQTWRDLQAIQQANQVAEKTVQDAESIPANQNGIYQSAYEQRGGFNPTEYANGVYSQAGAPNEPTRQFLNLLKTKCPAVFSEVSYDLEEARASYALIEKHIEQAAQLVKMHETYPDRFELRKRYARQNRLKDPVEYQLVRMVNSMPEFVGQCVTLCTKYPGRFDAFITEKMNVDSIYAMQDTEDEFNRDALAYQTGQQQKVKEAKQQAKDVRAAATPLARLIAGRPAPNNNVPPQN